MRVYVLRFAGLGHLMRGFDRVLEDPAIETCSIERETLELRFVAPRAPADRQVERLYFDGGLEWCSRHDFDPRALEAAGSARM